MLAQSWKLLEQQDADRLKDIGGIDSRETLPDRNGIDKPLIAMNERFPGGGIALQTAAHKLAVCQTNKLNRTLRLWLTPHSWNSSVPKKRALSCCGVWEEGNALLLDGQRGHSSVVLVAYDSGVSNIRGSWNHSGEGDGALPSPTMCHPNAVQPQRCANPNGVAATPFKRLEMNMY